MRPDPSAIDTDRLDHAEEPVQIYPVPAGDHEQSLTGKPSRLSGTHRTHLNHTVT